MQPHPENDAPPTRGLVPRPSGLSSRLILSVVVFAVVMTGAYYWLVHRPLYEQLRGLDEVEARLLFRSLRNQVRIDFSAARDELVKVAGLPAVRRLDKQALDDALVLAESTTTIYEKFTVLDTKGRVISRPSQAVSVGESRSNRDYFTGTMQSRRLFVGEPRPFGDGLSLSIGVPIFGGGGAVRGVLAGHVLLTGADSRFRKAASRWPSRSKHEAILLSRSGYQIAHSGGVLVGSRLADVDRRDHPLVRRADYTPAARPYTLDGVDYWGLVCRLRECDWILILQIDQGPLEATADSYVNRTALVFGLVFLVLLGGVVYYGARTIRPIGRLTSALVRFGQSGAARPLDTHRVVGEVGEAVAAFNQMVVDRSNAESELRLHGTELRAIADETARVAHRTRHEIAGELHDHISQNLAAAKIRLELLQGRQTTEAREDSLEIAVGLLHECIGSVSRLTNRLIQPAIEQLGLVKAVEALVTSYGNQGEIEWTFESTADAVAVDADVADVVYRGVAELLHNVVKHANATRVLVTLEVRDQEIHVHVSDDGVGFLPRTHLPRKGQEGGFGLFSLRERARQVGGALDIESAPEVGCSVTIVAPIPTQRETMTADSDAP